MYVTKRNMTNAVSNLTKHLDHVSEALAVSICYFVIGNLLVTFSFFPYSCILIVRSIDVLAASSL